MIPLEDVKYCWDISRSVYKAETYTGRKDYYVQDNGAYGSVLGFADRRRKRMVIAYEATEDNFKDWFRNIQALRKKRFIDVERMEQAAGSWMVHRGFYDEWVMNRDFSIKLAADASAQGYELWITGFSQGGACATIAYHEIYRALKKDITCVTFGAPAQGGPRWRDKVEKQPGRYLRVKTKYDVVTCLPPRALGYTHADPTLTLKTSAFPFLPLVRGVLNHLPQTYEKQVKKVCGV